MRHGLTTDCTGGTSDSRRNYNGMEYVLASCHYDLSRFELNLWHAFACPEM